MGASASATAPPEQGVTRYGIIGGSGVQVEGREQLKLSTPYGDCLVAFLDDNKQIAFVNRHLCTTLDSSGKATYAPPHEVNYHAMIWALVVVCGCKGVVALGSTGSLNTKDVPVGSVVMPDDYYMVRPEAMTFWGDAKIGSFAAPENGVGRIHYTPADANDEAWMTLRKRVQAAMAPVLGELPDGKVKLAKGQTPQVWPCMGKPDALDACVYVNSIGPRFETRAEIRSYQPIGHIVGMTCAREWALCEELMVPYCLVCFCDNACNGLSTHPKGALQEYLDHKTSILEVTSLVVDKLVAALSSEPQEKKE